MLRIQEETPSTAESRAESAYDFGQVCANLSNERTFLAWIWTGMMLMGFGVAIAKMRIALTSMSESTGSVLQSSGRNEFSPIAMGVSFLLLGLFTIIMSAYRYLMVQNELRQQKYRIANFYVLLFVMGLAVLGGSLLLHVLLLRQTLQ